MCPIFFINYTKIIKLFSNIYCRVMAFGPSLLQWICREWGQKLGYDETTVRIKGTQNRAAQSSQGEGTPRSRTGMRQPPLDHAGASFLFLGLPPPFRAPSLGGLCCYLFVSSVHPPPTLVSHPCLSSSARPLSHSFWRSVSCCGPHCPV